ncbi:hypothetical protein EYF80_008290 [Liparis tanakae]|uniref:Uncharacterized protein n=1 Tax=Liparis tanakae TaxID=230148 RepID=A0A4Z2IVH4_9TELE|nr:hypothetical protein EYF80_008290 [Liparis tanakae]
MQLFSSNVEARSVTISWATISTAWLSRPCFLTKASLARTAAPAPSDVGLTREEDKQEGMAVNFRKLCPRLCSLSSEACLGNAKRHYLQRTPPACEGVARSMRPAAGLGGPPLTWSTVAVGAAVVALAQSAVQNVLDVLDYQIDGHCRD